MSQAAVSLEITQRISASIEDVVRGAVTFTAEGAVEIARRLGVLPLAPQWTGWHVRAPDGSVLFWSDEDGALRPENDGLWYATVLYRGSEQFEYLTALLPQRPVNAMSCPGCDGKCRVVGSTHVGCESCVGLGWVQADGGWPWPVPKGEKP